MNPAGAINLHHHHATLNYWTLLKTSFDIICMVDGSWNINSKGVYCGGIGGNIVRSTGESLLIFSGPVSSQTALEAEIEAVLYVLDFVQHNKLHNRKVVVCTDSMLALNSIYKGLGIDFPLLAPKYDLDSMLHGSVMIRFIPRELNDNADQLAKSGASRSAFFLYQPNAL